MGSEGLQERFINPYTDSKFMEHEEWFGMLLTTERKGARQGRNGGIKVERPTMARGRRTNEEKVDRLATRRKGRRGR